MIIYVQQWFTIPTVVYAGFSVQALRSRIEDAQAKVLFTADVKAEELGKEVDDISTLEE